MRIRITNLDTEETYIAQSRAECRGVDVHIWDMMIITDRVVCMGHTIGEFV
jgi:hypothetical protein